MNCESEPWKGSVAAGCRFTTVSGIMTALSWLKNASSTSMRAACVLTLRVLWASVPPACLVTRATRRSGPSSGSRTRNVSSCWNFMAVRGGDETGDRR